MGKKTPKAEGLAGNLEKDFTKISEKFESKLNGARRFAWIYPQDMKATYKKEEAWMELEFFLPKGSYATTVLEEILHVELG
jgi:tRNA pseudouridine13 synthase